jgi:glycosyltransferase involved in cell wall biosynthesis
MPNDAFPLYAVLILTKDEEINISACLASIPSGVEAHMLDSMSTDRTAEIARELGAHVHFRPFDNYAAQRNHGLHQLRYPTRWVLMLDADERMTPELHEEIQRRLSTAGEKDTLFRLRRQDMFMGRWLRRSSGYPTWFGRLARIDAVHVEREINEEFVTDGQVAYLDAHLIHFPFNKGVAYWIERHNRYSTMEAATLLQEARSDIRWRAMFSGDPAIRRKWLKQVAYRMPGRPGLIFLYLLIARLGFLDGRAGMAYCTLRFMYECMINAKLQEAKNHDRIPR